MPVCSTLEAGVRIFLPLKVAGEVSATLAPNGLRRPPSWMASPCTPAAVVQPSMLSPIGPSMTCCSRS